MALKIFNTLSRKKEEFSPLADKKVGLYTCGPTVYDYPHIGNYRAYIFGDILKRALRYDGYKVDHIMNLTDVDDKTIRNSQAAGKSLAEFTEFFTEEFYKDRDALNILPADKYTKATDYIPEMVKIIETLLEKGIAYKEADGSVYFNIKKFKDYGKLAHLKKGELKEGASGRVKKDEYEKENAQDFALWKAYDESDGDVFWQTSLGKGRPGWHIECSAMSMTNLGESFDIHTGGVDNIFPHHENEIAQSEGATGKPFAKYWMHNEWLLVDGKKMSKSLGNFYTLRDIEKKGFSPLAYRYLVLQNHYKTSLNFTLESLQAAQTALSRLQSSFLDLGTETGKISEKYKKEFTEALDNDLETPAGLALAWELIRDENIMPADKKATLLDFDKVLGFGLDKLKPAIIPDEISKLAEEREASRKSGDFKKSDELREQIKNLGFEIKDTAGGYKLEKIK
jgi:cysteinyl-tRNA synthetase